jgi:hypothetical protein
LLRADRPVERAYPVVWCPVCGDRIGIYEQTVAIRGDEIRLTSRGREPLLTFEDADLLHRGCYAAVVASTSVSSGPDDCD